MEDYVYLQDRSITNVNKIFNVMIIHDWYYQQKIFNDLLITRLLCHYKRLSLLLRVIVIIIAYVIININEY